VRMVTRLPWVCQFGAVKKCRYHRWFVVLGMVAMLGALIATPMTTASALTMAGQAHVSAALDAMPCNKHVNPCPNCPQKMCHDMGTCLVNCLQPLSSPVAEASLQGVVTTTRVLPAPPQVATASLIPPLLRPPSV